MNEHESDAMWKLYSSNRQSIAIQSTIGRLKGCFKTKENIYIGQVEYVDYNNYEPSNRILNIGEANTLKTFLLKRKGFEHEKEIRAISNIAYNKHKQEKGILVNIDLSELIETIVISSISEDWFFNLTSNIIKKYSYKFSVKKSEFGIQPYM